MFQGVPAKKAAQRINDAIGRFEEFRQSVKRQCNVKVSVVREAWWEKNQQKQNRHERAELRQGIGAQVPMAASFGSLPIEDSGGAENREEIKRASDSFRRCEAFGEDCGEQGEEADRHRQSVPDESLVVRMQVVVARADCCSTHGDEENQIAPAVDGIGKRRTGTRGRCQDEANARCPYEKEKDVRNHVEEVRNSKQATLVCEIVISGILGDAWNEECAHHNCKKKRQ